MIKSSIACFLLGFSALSVAAQSDYNGKKFEKTETGLQYLMAKDEPGTTARVGDFMEFHIKSYIGDSVLFDSRKMNEDKPVPFQLQAPQFRGDLAEGFAMMSPGDVAYFRISVDTLMKLQQMLPEWVKPNEGTMLEYYVSMVSVKSMADKQKEAEEASVKQKQIDEELLQQYFKTNKLKPTKTASGMYYIISSKGKGKTPVAGDSVSMNYTGSLISGSKFDSNVDPSFGHVQPFWFILDKGMVIRGWDEGIGYLPKGSKATLYIPSGMAYGPQARGPQIPANSVMIFDVEVVDVVPAKK